MTPLIVIQSHFYGKTGFDLVEIEDLESWIKATFARIQQITFKLLTRSFDEAYSSSDSGAGSDATEEIEEAGRLINIFQDYVWEKLNIGHWKDVLLVWRKLYSYISLFKIIVLVVEARTSVGDLVKTCDNGLLMGYPVLDNILAKIAHQLHILNTPSVVTSETNASTEDTDVNSIKEERAHNIIPLPGPRLIVPSEELPSIELFSNKYFQREAPVLLHGITTHWPAMKKWSPDYIVKIGGSRTVPVEIGSKYTAEDWTQKLITIEEFVETYMKGASIDSEVGYVAQHQLFEQMPELMEDIRIPEYCCLGVKKDVEINAWFGPAGTMTPTHYDPNHNLLAQVFGTKFVRLFPPTETIHLYPNSSESLLFNTSQIDLEDVSACSNFPNLRNASYADVVLTPGSVLYIPPKWWHMVKSVSPSFSCSFWFE